MGDRGNGKERENIVNNARKRTPEGKRGKKWDEREEPGEDRRMRNG